MKRTFDFVAAAIGLLVATPLIALMIIVIRAESTGPGIFIQQRVGRNGRIFRCYKLRTMVHGTQNVPTHQSRTSEITRIGRRLRSSKLDELPQLWNVLAGDMSLVGPRPCLPTQAELIETRRRWGVLDLRPGITGLAQIRRVDMSTPALLAETDAEYLRHRSFVLDIKILFQTMFTHSSNGKMAV